MKNAYVLVICGPSGAGKSTLARRLRRLGWTCLDGDSIARSLYSPGSPLLRRMAKFFGASIINRKGALDRAALGALVFADRRARRRLTKIVYPVFVRTLRARLRILRTQKKQVVLDMAVYFDAGAPKLGDAVALVHAPLHVRARRLVAKGLAPSRALAQAGSLKVTPAQRRRTDLILNAKETKLKVWLRLRDFLKKQGVI